MRVLKPIFATLFLCLAIPAMALAFAAVAEQANAKPMEQQLPKTIDVTVTGCLVQGADPKIFLLDNARLNPKDSKEVAKRYLLASEIEDMPLKELVNHEVTATGVVVARSDIKPLPIPPTDKDLPVLTAKSIATIADRCINAGR
jgi:hypothetical protein